MKGSVCLSVLGTAPLAFLLLLNQRAVAQAAPAQQPAQAPFVAPPTVPLTPPPMQPPPPVPAPQLTPAQQKYGLPRNPLTGPPVAIDLTKPLTLDQALAIALQRQNVIAVAQAAANAANQRLVQARSSYYPQVTPTYAYTNTLAPAGSYFVSTSSQTSGTGSVGSVNPGGIGTGTPTGSGASTGAGVGGTNAGSTTGTSTTTTGTTTSSALTPASALSRQGANNGTGTTTGGTSTSTGTTQSTQITSLYTTSQTDLIAASYNIFDMGRREALVGAARRSFFAAQYEVGNQRQLVILNVTSDYYNLLRDKELVLTQQENVQAAQETLASIQAQVVVGNAAQSDTLQAQANLANAQVALLQAQSDYDVAQATLKNAIGIVSPSFLVLPDTPAPNPPTSSDTTPLDAYVQTAYDNRLDVKEQQENVNAQGYELRLARISAGISASVSITEGYQLNPSSGEEREFLVDLSYPLFDGGYSRAVVRENEATLEEQRRDLDELEQNVHLDVETAFQTREIARQTIVASQVAVQAGNTNYAAALEKQKNGLVNVVDVLTAEVARVTADVNLVNSKYNFYTAQAQLDRALGTNDPAFASQLPSSPPRARGR